MKSWKTTLGGSLQLLGTTLMGVGIVPGLTDMGKAEQLHGIVVAGFICQALGGFFAHLFAADTTQVKKLIEENNESHP